MLNLMTHQWYLYVAKLCREEDNWYHVIAENLRKLRVDLWANEEQRIVSLHRKAAREEVDLVKRTQGTIIVVVEVCRLRTVWSRAPPLCKSFL